MLPSGSTEPEESNAQSRNVHDDEKSAVGGTLPGGWSEVGSTIDHIVALSEAAFVVAVMCPYVPSGTEHKSSAPRSTCGQRGRMLVDSDKRRQPEGATLSHGRQL